MWKGIDILRREQRERKRPLCVLSCTLLIKLSYRIESKFFAESKRCRWQGWNAVSDNSKIMTKHSALYAWNSTFTNSQWTLCDQLPLDEGHAVSVTCPAEPIVFPASNATAVAARVCIQHSYLHSAYGRCHGIVYGSLAQHWSQYTGWSIKTRRYSFKLFCQCLARSTLFWSALSHRTSVRILLFFEFFKVPPVSKVPEG